MDFPAAGYFDAVPPNSDARAALDQTVAAAKQLLGAADEEALTIAGGSITPTVATVVVDGEGAAADVLTNILTTNFPEGRVIVLRCTDAARPITVDDSAGGAGEIHLFGDVDLVLADPADRLVLQRHGADWEELGRTHQNRKQRVIVVDEVAAAALALTPSDSGALLLSDSGAAARNYANLPAATAGLRFPFACDSAQGMRLVAAGSDTIQRHATTGAGGGYYQTPDEDGFQGELFCWKDGQWVVRFEQGSGSGAVA